MNIFNDITTLNDLSNILKVPKRKLTYILYKVTPDSLYTSFEIPKKNGGIRHINAPNEDLKDIQKKLSLQLWSQQNFIWSQNKIKPNISHAFIKEKSIITNAKIHRNKCYVLNMDLENFFDSFHFGRVRGFFEKNRYFLLPQNIATILAQLTCYNGCLPQGAPTSPIITNLICNILDMRLLNIAKKFKLDYTRYADDLTFSTNDKKFLYNLDEFKNEITEIIEHSGFMVNEKKTRLQFKNSRQEVTGLIVNKKINVNRDYYKKTRSMANNLYKNGEFEINGEKATINQLEGRFSFINQIDWYNNLICKEKNKKIQLNFRNLNGREKQYQMFLFYKYFFKNSKPCIVPEGKTDIAYIKSALKNLYKLYPNLIKKKSDGTFDFKISFLRRTKRLEYFLNIQLDGADTMKNIYNFYCNNDNANYPFYSEKLRKLGAIPSNPVIFILDNELNNAKKPLKNFTNHIKLENNVHKHSLFKTHNYVDITYNLYLLTHQLVKGYQECEIEDLFDNSTLNNKINGKTFERDTKIFNDKNHYGKAVFADYISKNHKTIDFNNFRPLLDNLDKIVAYYPSP